MTVFVDTSAFFAVLDAADQNHEQAKATWVELISEEANLLCTNYVLVETLALVQRRLGIDAVRVFQEDVVPVMHVEWVEQVHHSAGVTALLIASNRGLSLIDCVSFETMRRLGVRTAFAFDSHFFEQGFVCLPPTTD